MYDELNVLFNQLDIYTVMDWIDAMSRSLISWGFGMSAYQDSGCPDNKTPVWLRGLLLPLQVSTS